MLLRDTHLQLLHVATSDEVFFVGFATENEDVM
jgi:hypothetical protein